MAEQDKQQKKETKQLTGEMAAIQKEIGRTKKEFGSGNISLDVLRLRLQSTGARFNELYNKVVELESAPESRPEGEE